MKGLLASGIQGAGDHPVAPVLRLIKGAADLLYRIFPTFSPYSERMEKVYSSLRGADADWPLLLLAVGYMGTITLLFYLLADYLLKKKRLV